MKLIFLLIRLALISGIAVSAWLFYFAESTINPVDQNQTFEIDAGTNFRNICQHLVQQKIINHAYSFELLARLLQQDKQIKAGIYGIKPSISHYELINQLTSGIDNQASITFIEGWNFSDLRQALNKNEHIKHMTMAESDKKILEFVGAVENHPEGLFYPDTYYFNPNTSDREILKRAYDTMQRKLLREWQIRDQGLPYKTPYEALIMASIIEKETGRSSERAMIAGVFLNRLRIGMRLQTDPTVIYGLGQKFDGNIRKADLLRDSLYNTYTRDGLPPTPIAMPGLASIHAALHPSNTDALYFVGKGDGSHYFSRSLSEHNHAVTQYQLRQK